MVWFALWHSSQFIRVEEKELRIIDLHPIPVLLQSCDSFIVNKWREHILAPPFRAVCFKRKWIKVKTAPILPEYETEMLSLFFQELNHFFCLSLSVGQHEYGITSMPGAQAQRHAQHTAWCSRWIAANVAMLLLPKGEVLLLKCTVCIGCSNNWPCKS